MQEPTTNLEEAQDLKENPDYESAKRLLERMIQENETNSEAYYVLGCVFSLLGAEAKKNGEDKKAHELAGEAMRALWLASDLKFNDYEALTQGPDLAFVRQEQGDGELFERLKGTVLANYQLVQYGDAVDSQTEEKWKDELAALDEQGFSNTSRLQKVATLAFTKGNVGEARELLVLLTELNNRGNVALLITQVKLEALVVAQGNVDRAVVLLGLLTQLDGSLTIPNKQKLEVLAALPGDNVVGRANDLLRQFEALHKQGFSAFSTQKLMRALQKANGDIEEAAKILINS
eukprot:CAMPEP_0174258568 /NCGR_PEP_ID=MMETSP0439-20130205/7543_1 /TAXON_ID=0 /ORGANISM="Stereomyxa ramosa, Strain Chinc5" /LENGTH=289 /DNA_ID=CAMNT_0015342123 /DNA_START=6 /DNA_END=875 /DNA_ORIENTATION=-